MWTGHSSIFVSSLHSLLHKFDRHKVKCNIYTSRNLVISSAVKEGATPTLLVGTSLGSATLENHVVFSCHAGRPVPQNPVILSRYKPQRNSCALGDVDKNAHNNDRKKDFSPMFAGLHGPEPGGLFSWKLHLRWPQTQPRGEDLSDHLPGPLKAHTGVRHNPRFQWWLRAWNFLVLGAVCVSSSQNWPGWERADFAQRPAVWLVGTSGKQTPFGPGAAAGGGRAMPQKAWVQAPCSHSLSLGLLCEVGGSACHCSPESHQEVLGWGGPGAGQEVGDPWGESSGAARNYTVSRLNHSLAV